MNWEGQNNRRSWKLEEFERNAKIAENFTYERLDMAGRVGTSRFHGSA